MVPIPKNFTHNPPRWLKYSRIGQTFLDRTVIYMMERWVFFFVSLLVYTTRVYYLRGFYIVSYALGIYLLNLVIGFLSPAVGGQ